MNQIIKMLLLHNILEEILYFSQGEGCLCLVQLFPQLDNIDLWKRKLAREDLLLLPSVTNSNLKKYYFLARKNKSSPQLVQTHVDVYHPLYSLSIDFLSDLAFVLSNEATYGIYSLLEKKKILCLEMSRVRERERQREIEEICFNFTLHSNQEAVQAEFGVTIKETQIYSYLFSSTVNREKVLFVLLHHGLLSLA